MSALANFLRALFVDPRSRRALDETLADAREDVGSAGSAPGRLIAMLRSMAAIVRVCAGSLGREMRGLPIAGLATIFALSLVAGWVLPHAIRSQRPITHASTGGSATVGREISELPLPRLFEEALAVEGRQARRELSVRLLFCVAVLWFAWLGHGARQLSRVAICAWLAAGVLCFISIPRFPMNLLRHPPADAP